MLTLLFNTLSLLAGATEEGTINLGVSGNDTFGALENITLGSIISALIVLVLVIAALVFFFMLVLGGIRYITSGGDKGSTEAARSQITAALIGLVIVFAAWAVINLIQLFFEVDILNLQLESAVDGGGTGTTEPE